MSSETFIRWFEDIGIADVPSVGGKTASLGEMYRHLQSQGVRVPNGFGVTAAAYWHFMDHNRLREVVEKHLAQANLDDPATLHQVGSDIRHAILEGDIPEDLAVQIVAGYRQLCGGDKRLSVAIRSSATAEDLPDASFAGQQETYLNVRSADMVLLACKQCFASLFTDRAIAYREHNDFRHMDVALSICVQLMVRSDLAASGTMFTIDTETGFADAVLINAAYGLGENVVQGAVNPDEFTVFKPTLKDGCRPILQKHLGSKEFRMVYDVGGSKPIKNVPVSGRERRRFSINDDEILQLARWACLIEAHYSTVHGQLTPMDIEWARDGITGDLYILQARPETVQSQRTAQLKVYSLKETGEVLVQGRAVGERIGRGRVRVIRDVANLAELQPGEVLVTDRTDPDWEPMMKKAAAIVTDRGGRTCHAAIVSRELGLPAIVGTEQGTVLLRDGDEVTVSCAEGEAGKVYRGLLDYDEQILDGNALQRRPKTKMMLNLANPEQAFRWAAIANDGVGLARMEFIINHAIKIHPMALINFHRLEDPEVKAQIAAMTENVADKPDYFVDKLSQGIAMLAAAFYPNPVILRMSDFKTNEYANLIGGQAFEPHEENPMIGFRGASRYYSDRYRQGFALECRAVRRVREDMGLTNLKIMIPFCRTLDEGRRVLDELRVNGLERGKDELEVYVMCEIPANVILAEQFAELFDGFSIGSNDLTQLTLGIDRDSELLTELFDERNEAVKSLVSQLIASARKTGTKIGICGQAPSDYPEFAQFLVREGIDSLSLNPDSLIKTTLMVRELEDRLEKKRSVN